MESNTEKLQYVICTEPEEEKHKRAHHFEILALPTVLYALVFTILVYENYSGITVPIAVAATIIYSNYCLEKLGIMPKQDSRVYVIGMLLLGVSSFLTGNEFIIFCNTVGIVLLLICMLLHNFYDDSKWGFGRYVNAVLCAVFGTLGSLGEPFSDVSCYQKEMKGKKRSSVLYVLIGVAAAVPLLAIVIFLLCSADIVFADFVGNMRWDFGTVIGVSVTFLFVLFAAYCGLRYLGKGTLKNGKNSSKQYEPMIAATVLILLSVVYIFFCMIQFVYLFYGKMQLPENYTYAEYAREGFFQLLAVCILNLIVVLFVLAHFPKKRMLKALLTIISCCTYVMVASSAFRMTLYVKNYQLSFLRFLVFWGLGVITLFLTGILIQIFHEKFPLFRYGLVMFSVCYLALSFSHPDYWIAHYNLSAAEQKIGEKVDTGYLMGLSSDAAPAIAAHTKGGSELYWVSIYRENIEQYADDGIRKFNVSRAYAQKVFDI